jgi:hypothetical protein
VVGLVSGPEFSKEELASESPRVHPAELATRLRKVAHDAHLVVKGRHATPAEAEELSRRIEELREQTRGAHMFEIDRWLERALEVVIEHEQA